MPQLIALAMAGSVMYAGYKLFLKYKKRKAQKAHAQTEGVDQPRDLGELFWDETARVYRPRRDT
ncbi:MAG: hypothetical protein TECD_00192 [Hyphomicrobiaceae bacterium hypho_1]